MIDTEKYQKVLETGLTLDHFHILVVMKEGGILPKNKRIQGFINLLCKKGYIEDGVLTVQAMVLTENYITTTTTFTTTAPDVNTDGRIDFNKWVSLLHEKCQLKLKELTGGIQKTSKIEFKGRISSFPFLCNRIDLGKKLYTVISTYKLKDLDAIEKAVLSHIERCANNKEFFPLLKYYISKDGQSQLVTDLENPIVEESKPKSNQRFA